MTDDLTTRIEAITNAYEDIRLTAQQVVVGNQSLIEEIFISMISGGHLLIEGVPGTAKTTACKIIARLIGYDFKRVQGAVDIQPADIIGVRIYDRTRSEFILQKGPIFTNFLMIDEMNRLTPKTQSALLEAMSERQATIDGRPTRSPTPTSSSPPRTPTRPKEPSRSSRPSATGSCSAPSSITSTARTSSRSSAGSVPGSLTGVSTIIRSPPSSTPRRCRP
jgi:hypothetical protein